MSIEQMDKQPPDKYQPQQSQTDQLSVSIPSSVSSSKVTQEIEVQRVETLDIEPILIDVTPGEQSRQSMQPTRRKNNRAIRPDGITLTSIYHLFSGCLLLALTCLLVLPTLLFGAVTFLAEAEAFIGVAIFGLMSITSMFLCLLNLVVGYGLWIQRQWARSAAIALAFVSLLGFPIFTIVGGIILWYLLQPQVAHEFKR